MFTSLSFVFLMALAALSWIAILIRHLARLFLSSKLLNHSPLITRIVSIIKWTSRKLVLLARWVSSHALNLMKIPLINTEITRHFTQKCDRKTPGFIYTLNFRSASWLFYALGSGILILISLLLTINVSRLLLVATFVRFVGSWKSLFLFWACSQALA